jgi:TPR repeat protein
MKQTLVIIMALATCTNGIGMIHSDVTAGNPLNANNSLGAGLQEQRELYARQEARQEAQAQYDAAVAVELNKIYSKDPWRKIGETTNYARGTGWVEFQGKVEEGMTNGAVFRGKWGAVMTIFTDASQNPHLIITTDSNATSQRARGTAAYGVSSVQDTSYQHKILYGDDLFFVENFPYPASPGEGYEKMMALDSDYYSYTNSMHQVITIHKLIYGTPCKKTWSAEEIAAAKQKVDSKKKATQDKIFKSYQDAADRKDAYGLLRLGECYRNGEYGLEKDLAKAKFYLQQAADAGSPTAAEELLRLPQ